MVRMRITLGGRNQYSLVPMPRPHPKFGGWGLGTKLEPNVHNTSVGLQQFQLAGLIDRILRIDRMCKL